MEKNATRIEERAIDQKLAHCYAALQFMALISSLWWVTNAMASEAVSSSRLDRYWAEILRKTKHKHEVCTGKVAMFRKFKKQDKTMSCKVYHFRIVPYLSSPRPTPAKWTRAPPDVRFYTTAFRRERRQQRANVHSRIHTYRHTIGSYYGIQTKNGQETYYSISPSEWLERPL